MAKRQLMSVLIGFKRDGKDWSPKPGEVHDFTQEEITAIEEANPAALRLPPDDSKDKTLRATPVKVPVNTDKHPADEGKVKVDPVNSGAASNRPPGKPSADNDL